MNKLNTTLLIFFGFLLVPKLYAQEILYDNGPMITSIGTGINGEDESVLQFAALGMILRGFSNQTRFDNRLADDFVVTDKEWDIHSITFYTYVTGASVPTVTELYLQIWDGAPNQA